MNDILETLLEEAFDTINHIEDSVVRQLKFPEAENMIKVAVGMRRSRFFRIFFCIHSILGLDDEEIL